MLFRVKSGFEVLIPLIFVVHIVGAQDYCDPTLCRNGFTHIGCGNNAEVLEDCPAGAKIVDMVPGLKKFILTAHNSHRYLLAAGRVEGFEPAIRMAKMQWDDELARLAELNVKQCWAQHDGCHNTQSFPYSSQNIHLIGWNKSITYMPMDDLIMYALQVWFDEEAKNATMTKMNNYVAPSIPGKDYSHFAKIAQERNTHLGCAIVRYVRGNKRYQLMTCNYAYSNVINRPVYRAGPTASGCTTGVDPADYTLCSVKEVYNVKSLDY